MTPIESIYEIEAALSDLQKYLHSKDRIVFKKAQIKYKQLVDRFFKEHVRYVKPEQRIDCLDDVDYFIGLMESVKECYDMIVTVLPTHIVFDSRLRYDSAAGG